jgi:hypothetical protein
LPGTVFAPRPIWEQSVGAFFAKQKQQGVSMELVCIMADLIDVRCKVTEESNQVLEAHARATNIDKSEVIRQVLHEWALREIHKATLVTRLTRREGIATDVRGGLGNV